MVIVHFSSVATHVELIEAKLIDEMEVVTLIDGFGEVKENYCFPVSSCLVR